MFQILSLAKGGQEGTGLPDLGKEVPGLSVSSPSQAHAGLPALAGMA